MGMNITEKLIKNHLVSGEMIPGKEIAIKIDQTLTQDSTGTMAYLQFEAIGIPRVKTEKSVAYIDHNTLQTGFENADDHKYIQTVTSKPPAPMASIPIPPPVGVWLSEPNKVLPGLPKRSR